MLWNIPETGLRVGESVVQATSCFWGSQSAGLEDVCIFRGEVRRLPCICSVLAL